ncbi:hypothetical protein GCM10018952_41490 [Streptosporangium vulgare]
MGAPGGEVTAGRVAAHVTGVAGRVFAGPTAWSDGAERWRGATLWTGGVARPRGVVVWRDGVVDRRRGAVAWAGARPA